MTSNSLAVVLEEIRVALASSSPKWQFLLDDCTRCVRSGRADVCIDEYRLRDCSSEDIAAFRTYVYDAVRARLAQLNTSEVLLLSEWFAEVCARVTSYGEETLRLAERRFRMAIDRSNIAAFETDLVGHFTWLYNSKLPEALGQDMAGTRIDDLMPPEVAGTLEQARHEVLAGAHATMDVTLRYGGEEFHRMFSFGLVKDAKGNPLAYGGSSVDTTEIKRAYAELSRAVAYREQLMGILGHDLRNPLSAVTGITGLLQFDESLPQKTKEGLSRIEGAARRMSEMIETILDFTRIRFSEGGLPVSRADMDLRELCRDVVDEAMAAHRGRQVSLETAGDLCGRWDRPRMAQVLSNLLGNALTHGDEKEPVKLNARSNVTSVTLDVVNQGPTITPEQMETLFEPFVRGAGSNHARRRSGLGLGLYIAKQIVVSHGGTLSSQSCDGTTMFTVVLPRHEA